MVFYFSVKASQRNLCALVVELVDTRDLKSLDVRVVPVQVRPGAPSQICDTSSVGRGATLPRLRSRVRTSCVAPDSESPAFMLGFFVFNDSISMSSVFSSPELHTTDQNRFVTSSIVTLGFPKFPVTASLAFL